MMNVGNKIDFIQTCIKSKIGIGKHIAIDYFSRVNKNKPSKYINYNFRRFKSDEYLLANEPKEY